MYKSTPHEYITADGEDYSHPKLYIDHYPTFIDDFYQYMAIRYGDKWATPEEFKHFYDIEYTPNPLLHRFENGQYLEMVPAVGYYGFGYSTIVPNVINFNLKNINEYYVNNTSNTEEYIGVAAKNDMEVFNNTPPEYAHSNQGPFYLLPTGLRNASFNKALSNLDYNYQYFTDAFHTRYNLGSADPLSPNDVYNPLKKYGNKILSSNYDLPNNEYHKDFTGEWNPVYINAIMSYQTELKSIDPVTTEGGQFLSLIHI